MNCPSCHSSHIKKNGHIHNGKQLFRCKECGRQFVADNQKKSMTTHDREIIRRLFAERISLRGICRAMRVSLTWRLNFFTQVTDNTPDDLGVTPPSKGKLTLELDEMWSFVGAKDTTQWIWVAIDREKNQIVGWYVGKRDEQAARQLWNSLPGVYRQCAVCSTDFGDAYAKVIPSCRHRPVGKRRAKPVILNEQTAHFGNARLAWFARHCHVQRANTIIVGRSHISCGNSI